MTSPIRLTQLQGVDVSEYRPVELTRENLISAGFEKCPDSIRHLLVHAVQMRLPLPSLASMKRTEKRNQIKASKGKNVQPVRPQRRPRRQARRKIRGTLKRLAPARLPAPAIPKPVRSLLAFKVRSPEENVLKAARKECLAQLEGWFGKCEPEKEAPPITRRSRRSRSSKRGRSRSQMKAKPVKAESKLPIYFQKKHKSHKRRLRERWQLIKANRDKLIELFGGEILHPNCRISIRDVKAALGLAEGTAMDVEGVGEFMAMVNEDEENSYSSDSSSSYSSRSISNSQSASRHA